MRGLARDQPNGHGQKTGTHGSSAAQAPLRERKRKVAEAANRTCVQCNAPACSTPVIFNFSTSIESALPSPSLSLPPPSPLAAQRLPVPSATQCSVHADADDSWSSFDRPSTHASHLPHVLPRSLSLVNLLLFPSLAASSSPSLSLSLSLSLPLPLPLVLCADRRDPRRHGPRSFRRALADPIPRSSSSSSSSLTWHHDETAHRSACARAARRPPQPFGGDCTNETHRSLHSDCT